MGGRRRHRLSVLAPLLGAVAVAAHASALESGVRITLDPNLVGRPSALVIDADRQAGQADGRMAQEIVLSLQRGFRIDTRSRGARCTGAQANDFACPRGSRIGSGQAVVTASGAIVPGGSQDFTASIELFLRRKLSAGDLAGVVVSVEEPATGQRGTAAGRLRRLPRGPYGHELRFEDLDSAVAPPPGVTVELKRLHLRVAARRTVTHARLVSNEAVPRRITHHLITNPSRCDGNWNGHASVTFSDGSSLQSDLAARCRRR